MYNTVQKPTGAASFSNPRVFVILLFLTLLFGVVIAKKGLVVAAMLILLPFILFLIRKIFDEPKVAIYVVIIIGFFANGISRYIPGPPYGLSIDGVFVLGYLALFFKNFNTRIDWSPAARDVTFLASLWFGYALLQLVNPEALSRVAWFYAMRGVALYFFLMVPLVLILIRNRQDFNRLLYIWAVISLLATFKGILQLTVGVDPWEKAWLDGGGAVTHLLFGKLRVFSFYSDAGQFGASQAHTGVVASIIFMHAKKKKEKIFFGIVALMSFYGMFISGTRGAIAVPAMGFFLYLVLIRNVKLVTLGTIMGIAVFIFFKFTTIGSGVYAINRMRTGFDPNDKSLQVRLENQRILRAYLATRPIGGGIGSAGNWGQRFSPNGFLANVPTDSWYVMIWAEQGIVGLTLHLFILFYIVGKGSYLAMFHVRDPVLQGKLFALVAGIFGIMAASYGNGVFGQIPTGPLMYLSMGLLFTSKTLDESITEENKANEAKLQETT
jgi:hypothetical protein